MDNIIHIPVRDIDEEERIKREILKSFIRKKIENIEEIDDIMSTDEGIKDLIIDKH